MKSLED